MLVGHDAECQRILWSSPTPQVIQMNDGNCTVVDDDARVGSVTRMIIDAVASKAQGINHQLVGGKKEWEWVLYPTKECSSTGHPCIREFEPSSRSI